MYIVVYDEYFRHNCCDCGCCRTDEKDRENCRIPEARSSFVANGEKYEFLKQAVLQSEKIYNAESDNRELIKDLRLELSEAKATIKKLKSLKFMIESKEDGGWVDPS